MREILDTALKFQGILWTTFGVIITLFLMGVLICYLRDYFKDRKVYYRKIA